MELLHLGPTMRHPIGRNPTKYWYTAGLGVILHKQSLVVLAKAIKMK
jgi:hypothetical protein